MDLDESFVSSDSEENSQSSCRQQLFIDWFLSVIIQQDVLENANEMQFSTQLSVIVNEDHLFLSDATNNKQIRFTPHQSWIIVYLFCQSETISIYTFSGKLLIKLIIDACVTDLRLDVVDVYRVLAFLTDHPIIDLQLAYHQIHPDQCCDNLSVMKKRVGNTECTSDKSESQQLGEIHDYLMDKLRIENTMNIYLFISCSTNASLAAMEYFGIEVDLDKWEIFHQCVTSTLQSVENEITRITGSAICLSSPSHLKEIIYNQLRLHECLTEQQWLQMGIDNLIEIKSTNELVLSKLAEFHWLPKLVIKYRQVININCKIISSRLQISKTKSIYVDSFALFIDRNKNVIRGTWDQNSCVTGRIYCSRPNLQAFPRHQLCFNDESVSLNVKSIFLSSNDYILVSADYAHIELRLYAHLANDERLIGLFHSTDAGGSEDDLFTNLSCLLLVNTLLSIELINIKWSQLK